MYLPILESAIKQFQYYKSLGEKSIDALNSEQMNWKVNEESNSIATIIIHLHGNMLSRWTDFLTSDGEKPWRNRDNEFSEVVLSKEDSLQKWEQGWQCLFRSLSNLKEEDFSKTILIRNEPHSIMDAIHRQLAHYPYHVGQIVFISKMIQNTSWKSLSIPKGKSNQFNKEKMGI